MQNIEFSVTCPYCGQAFRVASQPSAKVQCQCPNCHQQMVFDAPQAANAYQPQQPQQYNQPAQQQYNQPMQQQYGQPIQHYGQPMQQQYGQPAPQQYNQPQQPQQYAQPMQQQYGQPVMQQQSAQPAPQPYGTQPGGQQMMDTQPSPYYQQAQDGPDSDYIDDDDDEQSSFMEYYFWDLFFRHYADFRGKTPQRQYLLGTCVFWPLVSWLYFIILYLLFGNSIVRVLNEGTPNDGAVIFYALWGLGMLVMLIPGIAACVRRLHDTGKSGYYFFLAFIPFVGPLILFILCCAKGETESRHAKFGTPDGAFLCLFLALLFSYLKWAPTIYLNCATLLIVSGHCGQNRPECDFSCSNWLFAMS